MKSLQESILDIEDVTKSAEDIATVPTFEKWKKSHKAEIERYTSGSFHYCYIPNVRPVTGEKGKSLYPSACWVSNKFAQRTFYEIRVVFAESLPANHGVDVSIVVAGLMDNIVSSERAWKCAEKLLYYLTANDYLIQYMYDDIIKYLDEHCGGKRIIIYDHIPAELFEKRLNSI